MYRPKAHYYRIIHFLSWLATQSHPYEEIVERLKENNERIDGPMFERLIRHYKEAILSGLSHQDASRKASRLTLCVIQKFAKAGVFPQIRLPKRINGTEFLAPRQPRPSLAEAKKRNTHTKNISQLIDATSDRFNVKFDLGEDTIAFAENLEKEINQREDLPKNLPQAICILCDERLTALRVSASDKF